MTLRQELAKKSALVGAGAGLVFYALFGLMQGALLGGTAGILFTNWVFGPGAMAVMAGELITRAIIAGAMLAGVLVSLVMSVTITATAGYILGSILGVMAGERETAEAGLGAAKR
ncbi:MAG TPA: hypothetical protein VGB23_00250 [Nitrospirota bacterium]|jgi:hypothetical protein